MKALVREKGRAIQLRRKGNSYKDILSLVPVAKSTLSEWLRELPLTAAEKQALKRRKDANISRGRIRAASVLHSNRMQRESVLHSEAKSTFSKFRNDQLFQIGIALYWAEGSKRQASSFSFTNSDPDMIAMMIKWLEVYLNRPPEEVRARLYIHKPYAAENCEGFWHEKTAIPKENFRKTIYKPTGLLVKKRPNYKGCLRIECSGRPSLLKMLFWQSMLVEQYLKR